MLIDGCGASEAWDKSGERLKIDGLDISSVPDGTVYLIVMPSKYLIYGLVDPRDGQLRYVGKSCSGLHRPKSEWNNALKGREGWYKRNWIKGMFDSGVKNYSIVVIQDFEDVHVLKQAEIFWISYFKKMGCKLTNLTAGGDSHMTGWHHSEKTKKKMVVSAGGMNDADRAIAVELYNSGSSLRSVGSVIGRRSNVVMNALLAAGISLRNKKETRGKQPRRFALPPDQIKEVIDRYISGQSVINLSKEYGIGQTAIRTWLVKSGVEMHWQNTPTMKQKKEDVIRSYCNGNSVTNLIKEFGISKSAIYRLIKGKV